MHRKRGQEVEACLGIADGSAFPDTVLIGRSLRGRRRLQRKRHRSVTVAQEMEDADYFETHHPSEKQSTTHRSQGGNANTEPPLASPSEESAVPFQTAVPRGSFDLSTPFPPTAFMTQDADDGSHQADSAGRGNSEVTDRSSEVTAESSSQASITASADTSSATQTSSSLPTTLGGPLPLAVPSRPAPSTQPRWMAGPPAGASGTERTEPDELSRLLPTPIDLPSSYGHYNEVDVSPEITTATAPPPTRPPGGHPGLHPPGLLGCGQLELSEFQCSTSCGLGAIWRRLACSTGREVECDAAKRPAPARRCYLRPCSAWRAGEWGKCSRGCGGGAALREVQCFDLRDPRPLRPFHCQAISSRPRTHTPCNAQPCLEWYASSWGQCSRGCGGGAALREVQCFDLRDPRPLRPFHCQAISSRPRTHTPCNAQPCLEWYASSWGQCSAQCGGGVQHRLIKCVDTKAEGEDEVEQARCQLQTRPHSTNKCHLHDCEPVGSMAWLQHPASVSQPSSPAAQQPSSHWPLQQRGSRQDAKYQGMG
ncbi:hypothetical protein CRUP_034408 [Coryphaenoides rupestris]|nr:hypothetical protein CRUP_034408 [Coryphaenoides rupestris]